MNKFIEKSFQFSILPNHNLNFRIHQHKLIIVGILKKGDLWLDHIWKINILLTNNTNFLDYMYIILRQFHIAVSFVIVTTIITLKIFSYDKKLTKLPRLWRKIGPRQGWQHTASRQHGKIVLRLGQLESFRSELFRVETQAHRLVGMGPRRA